MILLEKAIKIVLESISVKDPEEITLMEALHRIIAEDIFSDLDMPAFDRSAMDGYACKMKDIHRELKVIEVIAAGQFPQKVIHDGECSQIMTGAPIPEGADCVLMVEDIEKTGENTIRYKKEKTKKNIRYQGEDLKKGQIVIKAGTCLEPAHLALLATVGKAKVTVYQRPVVGIISTGDELVEPDQIPVKSQIRNSNAYQLYGQVLKNRAIPLYFGIAEDKADVLYNAIKNALEKSDILLLTGGVSMGEFDYVPEIMKQLGIEIKFQKIAVQPGKPTTFGVKGQKLIFGLPGNPVSSFIQYELVVKPAVYRIMGLNYHPAPLYLPFGIEYTRKHTERMAWFPVVLNEKGEIIPSEYHGSAHINSLADAFGIASIEIGKSKIEKGELVHVRLI
ncbi:MAG TPA: molybdopterin molybdotransferase MoeA [Bacteroidia bacterium]|nr:molybdopterin molybdotransferase MoeA [Bacteroidia bacterium]HRS58962.1 molybdopterin molybdotransferase MoeA [Bacteroidia bacterium]HRU67549.1 molybdopterin molybdotransferase MoeA [Bacteroidia bacterium]